MGNSGSAANSENDDEEASKETVKEVQKESFGGLDSAVLDLGILFDPKQLRIIAEKIKEDSTLSPLQQHYTPLTRWLEERRSRGAETVSLVQFVDSITNKGVSKEVATEIFQQFDLTGDGVVDLDYLHEMLDLSSRSMSGFAGVRSDLQTVNKLLQDCVLGPGFLDAFTTSKTMQANHGKRILKFLCQNRALSTSIPLPAFRGFITTTDMRLKVLNTHLNALREHADSKKREPALQADEILKPISRCFTSAEVSSNRNDASKLIDNDNGTYWQSDGPARSHWVRLTIPQNVVLKQLSMYVVSSDQSYMPHHVVVYGGRDESNLRELNDVRIPNHITGDFTLLENVKVPYQIIQISIKRCHSDGCDTRIRQVKAIGYRVVKSKGVSVIDATAMWYLSVLASTAEAALPIAPNLSEAIIEHTRMSLSHMGPLSLSSSSTERPGFLSSNVMEQMEKFLTNIICLKGVPEPNELVVLLEFALSRGCLGSILDVLKLVLEKIDMDYPAAHIFRSLVETEEKAIRKHGQKLSVVILSCDGGMKDSSTTPSNVLTDNWKTDVYLTSTGKTKCNLAFGLKSGNVIQLTKVIMKLSKGSIGPKAGLIFVFDSDNIKDENGSTLFQPLQEYDDWTENEYKQYREKNGEKLELKPYEPVGYFAVEKDWTDVNVAVDYIKTGNCVVIKFLGAQQQSAERLGVVGIQLYGYEQNEDYVFQQKQLDFHKRKAFKFDVDEMIPGFVLFLQTLHFLQVMCRDAVNIKSSSKDVIQEKDATVDIHDVSMEQIWNLYTCLISGNASANEFIQIGEEMLLNLFHIALPFLCPSVQKIKENKKIQYKGKKVSQEKMDQETNQVSSHVFQLLCDIVDEDTTRKGVHGLAKMIILDGAEVFFPDTQTRRVHLLSLVDKVMENGKAVSLSYTFESLCRFFSNKDASGLLGLPDSLPQSNFDPDSVIHVMKTLVSVAYKECLSQISGEVNSDIPSNLVLLLSAMQKSLMAWCHFQCDQSKSQPAAGKILTQYIELICEKCEQALLVLEASQEKMKVINLMEYSFVSITMRQLILFMNFFCNVDIDCIKILHHLRPVAFTMGRIAQTLPELFLHGAGTTTSQEHTVLREWEIESEHDYRNNMNFNKVFNCPGCTSFRVEFDARCETERRYDYLEFTDSSGAKRRFDQNAGSDKWPTVVNFDAGQRLDFLFHSDGSNTAWGYKFKVLAIGSPDVAVSWMYDLHLNISRCVGVFCGNALNSRKALGLKKTNEEEKDEEGALLHSELWASLFRGGYMIGKLERSLSGFHRNNPSDSNVNSFLCAMISNAPENSSSFLQRCQSQFKGQRIGGDMLDSVVCAVFAALIWHTQELREMVSHFADEHSLKDIPSGILQAYTSAENIRRPLLEKRQKLLAQTNENSHDPSTCCNPDAPIVSCREKALFLLKFAGLSKFTSRKSMHNIERRTSVMNRNPKMSRQDSYDQRRSSHNFDEPTEKFPSFQLILDFVTNNALSHHKIHDLLQHRNRYASTITKIYTYASEYIDHMMEIENLEVPCILFLQSILSCQDHFPQHYADYLNGCGLEQENAVRNAFYTFIKKLATILASNMDTISSTSSSSVFLSAQAYLLHFLDVDWKTYDYHFVSDLNLPFLLVQCLQAASLPSTNAEEEAELKMYERHKKFFEEACKESIDTWCTQHRQRAPIDIQRDINLFIARYSGNLDVVITCDGCQETIKGRRHRCLNCTDMDLCSKCFSSGNKPNEHNDQHEVINLRYTCDGCRAFIVETRIHCNQCDDFDLCLGCYKNNIFPSPHDRSHSVTRSRLIRKGLLPNKTSKGVALQSYIHHHSWLQFCALSLSLSESLQGKKLQGIDQEYVKEAVQLLLNCLEKMTDYLQDNVVNRDVDHDVDDIDSVKDLKKGSEEVLISSFTPTIAPGDIGPSGDATCPDKSLMRDIDENEQLKNVDVYFTISTERHTPVKHVSETERDSESKCCDEDGVALESNAGVTKTMSENNDAIEVNVEDNEVMELSHKDSTETMNEMSTSEVSQPTSTVILPQDVQSSNTSLDTLQNLDNIVTVPILVNINAATSSDDVNPSELELKDVAIIVKTSEKEEEIVDTSLETTLYEKVLALIGAVIPPNKQLPTSAHFVDLKRFIAAKLLPCLYKMIRSSDKNSRLCMLTLGILSKILQCFGPEIADTGVLCAMKPQTYTNPICGMLSVSFLFNLGADSLKNADLETASAVESVLRNLWCDSNWKECITDHSRLLLQQLTQSTQDPLLTSLFSLMFLAGFPDIFRIGMQCVVKEIGNDPKQVIVLGYSHEDGTLTAINFKNRKKMTVKENNVDSTLNSHGIHDEKRLNLLLHIVKKNVITSRGENMSLERLWVLALACKALLNILKNGVGKDELTMIINSGVLPSIVALACQGTGFSKQWLLRDLEVFSWKLYKSGEVIPQLGETLDKKEVMEKDILKSDNALEDIPKSPLDGLDEETKLCMDTIHDALLCPYPILRAIYEHNGQDREKLLEEVQRSFDGNAGCIIRASEEIQELAKQWEKKDAGNADHPPVDSSIDAGILKFQPQTVEFKDLQAKPEGGENPNKLISSLTEEEINETMARQRRLKSSELLRKQLEQKNDGNSRGFAEKVNYAVAVGYSRYLVGCLFAQWHGSDDIISSMLENIAPQNIVGLLDLIQSLETKEHFQKVVFNFIHCCNKQLLQPLALSAVQCMSEVRLATESRESDHKYKNNAKIEDKVHIPGATSLFIRFDDRCATEYSCDELVLSSSANFQQNRRVFSGSTDWQDFEMPGDTVYYRFTSDGSNNDWGWKFVVTGGQLGRFETGCGILSALLAQDLKFARRLPLKQLWSWLIVVACNQVGQQRLMATGLLLRILQIAAGDPYIFGDDAGPSLEKNRPNLTLLRPLWTLYTNSIESDAGTSLALVSPVVRGLSELFLVVENVAQDWGEADDLVAGLATNENLRKCFTKVVKNIAAIGLAINLPNKAIELLKNAKNIPVTPAKEIMNTKKNMSTIQLRISGADDSDLDDSDLENGLMMYDDELTHGDDDEDEEDSDTSSDLSQPEPPP